MVTESLLYYGFSCITAVKGRFVGGEAEEKWGKGTGNHFLPPFLGKFCNRFLYLPTSSGSS